MGRAVRAVLLVVVEAAPVSLFYLGQRVWVKTPGTGSGRMATVVGVKPGKTPDCITVLNDGCRPTSVYRVNKAFCTAQIDEACAHENKEGS